MHMHAPACIRTHARPCTHGRAHTHARAYAHTRISFGDLRLCESQEKGLGNPFSEISGQGRMCALLGQAGKQGGAGEQALAPAYGAAGRAHPQAHGAHVRRCPQARDSLKKKQSCFFRECAKLPSEVLDPVAHPRTRRGARAHACTRIRERTHAPACARSRLHLHTYGGMCVCMCVPARCSLPLTSC